MIDYENADLFLEDGVNKQIILQFDETQITNSMIYSEQFAYTQSICSDSELKFGGCEASMLEFRITSENTDWAEEQMEFTAKIVLNKDMNKPDYSKPFTIGTFKVQSSKMTPDRKYRDVIAYDRMYNLKQVEISNWINSLIYPMTLKTFRQQLFEKLECECVEADLINDSVILYAPPLYNELYAADVLKDICELNGCFGIINNQNQFEFLYLKSSTETSDYTVNKTMYPRYGAEYEEYLTKGIGTIILRQKHTNKEIKYINEPNPYTIETRVLYLGEDTTLLNTICSRLYSKLMNVSYVPMTINDAIGNYCLECGDKIDVTITLPNGTEGTKTTYVLGRKLSGIQRLKDSYTAQGVRSYTYDDATGGGTTGGNISTDTTQNMLLLYCKDEELLVNIPENTPNGTLVGTVTDIKYLNEKTLLRNIGNLYYFYRQYGVYDGSYIVGLNDDGKSLNELVLTGKYLKNNIECEADIVEFGKTDSELSDQYAIYSNLVRLTIAADTTEYINGEEKVTFITINSLGNCPILTELIIEAEYANFNGNSIFGNCKNLKIVRFKNLVHLDSNFSFFGNNSYIEEVYFPDDFSNSLQTPMFSGVLSKRLAIYGGFGNLNYANIVNCKNLEELILGEGVTMMYGLTELQNLKSLTIQNKECALAGDPNEVKTNCPNLTDVYCPEGCYAGLNFASVSGITVHYY